MYLLWRLYGLYGRMAEVEKGTWMSLLTFAYVTRCLNIANAFMKLEPFDGKIFRVSNVSYCNNCLCVENR